MPANIRLGASFDFPPYLSIPQYEIYQRDSVLALKELEGREDVSSAAAWAIIFGAANNAGLYQNWNSHYMPSLDYKTSADVHAFTALWAAQETHKWIEGQRSIDPKALWRRLMRWIGMERLRRNLQPHGVALGFRIWQAFLLVMTKARSRGQ